MNSDQVMSLIRNVLQFGGGILVTKGIITEPDMLTAVGAIASLLGVVWSMITHRTSK